MDPAHSLPDTGETGDPMRDPTSGGDGRRRRTDGRRLSRIVLAVFFASAGVLHFTATEAFARIVPFLPAPERVVQATGLVELAAAAGLVLGPIRATGTLLAIYCAAVLPANVFMALERTPVGGIALPAWLLWLRVALQGPLIGWVLWATRR